MKTTKTVRDWLAKIGRKGGKTTGATKARTSEQARAAAQARWTDPMTPRQSGSVISLLATAAVVTAALLWGTGCATTPGDCMLTAICANQRLAKAGIDSRIGIVSIDTLGEHAVVVWREPRSRLLWIYDGQGSYESAATDFTETNALANTITTRHLLVTTWERWVGP